MSTHLGSANSTTWPELSIAEIAKVVSGATPSTDKPEYWGGPIVWVTPADLSTLDTRHLLTSERTLTELGLARCAARLLPPRSLVISSRAPIGHMALPLVSFCTNQGCKSLAFYEGQDPDFHYYNLRFWVRRIHDKGEGTTFAEISKTALERVRVPVPRDVEVQSAIASLLALVDRAIEQTEALLTKQRRIKNGLVHALLTRGLDAEGHVRTPEGHRFKPSPMGLIPESWEVFTLEVLVARNAPICYGIVQVGQHSPEGVPTIAIRNLANIDISTLHRTAGGIERSYSRSRCVEGDLLLSIKATTGEVAIAPRGFQGNISRDVARIRFRPGEVPEFFKYQLQSAAGRQRLDEITVGTTRREISIAPLRGLLVARPHPDEQRAIATRIQSLEADLGSLAAQVSKLRLKKLGLMQDLLTQRVSISPLLHRRPDPNDGLQVMASS